VSIAEILTGTYFAPLGMGKGLLAILHWPCDRMRAAVPGRTHRRIYAQKRDGKPSKMSFGQKGSLLFSILNHPAAGGLDRHHDL
jgi:hypothetical protein